MSNDQISLPYLAAILVLTGLIIRYLFFGGPPTQRPPPSHEAFLRAREAAVERIQQMFPQADRRSILWDLQRNGGSIQTTTERILSGSLETPPITFQPAPASGQATRSASAGPATRAPEKSAQPDLITRYKLEGKLKAPVEGSETNGRGWSSNRDERQSSLQRRRDEMILAARRKMESKIAAEKAAQGN